MNHNQEISPLVLVGSTNRNQLVINQFKADDFLVLQLMPFHSMGFFYYFEMDYAYRIILSYIIYSIRIFFLRSNSQYARVPIAIVA